MLKRGSVLFLIVLAVVPVLLAACSSPATEADTTETVPIKNNDGYIDINVDQLNNMLEQKDFSLVNVHIPYAGDIPKTDTSIPFDDLESNLNQLPADKDAPVVVYCRSGNMSTQAAETLVGLGYTNVMEVDGGMNAWQSAGYELLANQ